MNALNLTIINEKIKTIIDIQFSIILKTLKIYLELTDWLQFYILYYVQITASLQTQKTALRKTSLAKRNIQKQHISQILFSQFNLKKIHIFKTLQDLFAVSIFLVHFNFNWCLYINVNVFKQYDFSTVIYHVEEDLNDKNIEFLHHRI